MKSNPAAASRILIVLMLIVSPLSPLLPRAQKEKPKTAQDDKGPLTYRLPVDVIVVNAAVTDKKGNPVTDLAVEDFRILEDGKQQPIHTFALESYRATSAVAGDVKRPSESGAAAQEPNYSRPRMISLVIDDVTSPADDHYVSVLRAVRRFIEQDMGPGDQVALVAGSGHSQIPFTGDKQLLLEQIKALAPRLNVMRSAKSTCPTLTDLQAKRIVNGQVIRSRQDDFALAVEETLDCLDLRQVPDGDKIAESHSISMARIQWSETEQRSRTLIQTLRQHIRSLRHFQANKSIILFSNGFVFEDLVYELQDAVDQALRSGIVLNTVDLRGLLSAGPQGEERIHAPRNLIPVKQALLAEDLASRDGPLNQLARDTGGIFYHNSNDLYAGMHQISERRSYFYVLTYASPSQKADGRYHRIKLEVSRPGIELTYRNGYYAPKEELTFERRRKEDILEAMQAPGDINEIPIHFSYNFYQLDDTRYEIALVIQVDASKVPFPEEESRRRNQISLVVVAFDESDNYVDGLVKTVEFNLTPPGFAQLISQGLASKAGFQLASGRYKIRAVVREASQGKMGSVNRTISIP